MKRGLERTPGNGSVPSMSLWSLSSSFAQKQQDNNPPAKNSMFWESKLYVKLAVYSVAIASSTIFRFPESAYTYGGSLFAAYILLLVLVIQPIVYLELLLGQMYLRQLPIRSDQCIYKYTADSMRIVTAFMVIFFIPNQSMEALYSHTLVEFGYDHGGSASASQSQLLPWCSCAYLAGGNDTMEAQEQNADASQIPLVFIRQNPINCVDQQDYFSYLEKNIFGQILNPSDFDAQIAPALYLKKEIHLAEEHSKDNNILQLLHWKLILSGLISAGLIYFFTTKQRFQAFFVKTLLWTSASFPVIIIIILIFQLNQSGKVSTMLQLLSIDWSHFKDIRLWVEAVRLAILTSGVGLGLHPTISSSTRMSYKKYHQISWMFVIFTATSVLILTLVFFSEIEYFTILSGALRPDDAVPHIPGISTILLATIFCKLNSISATRIANTLFAILKLLVLCRIQVLAFDTIYRTLNVRHYSGRYQKISRRFLKIIIVVFMQVILTIPYSIKHNKVLFNNFYLLSGTWPIIVFLLLTILHFSKQNFVDMFEEDLYLSYRLKLPKLFQFQLRSYSVFTLILLCTILLSFEMGQNLYEFLKQKSAIEIREDWVIIYGVALNVLPFLMFFLGLLCQLMKCKSGNKEINNCNQEGRRVRKLVIPSQEQSTYPYNLGRSNFSTTNPALEYGTKRDEWRATIWPQALRRPQHDLATVLKSVAPINDDAEASDSYSLQSSLQNSLEYQDLKSKIPMSSFRDPNPKRKPPRHRVVRQIRHRRPPLPPEWSPGGLGDFSLYNAHLNGKPPGPDSMPSTTTETGTGYGEVIPPSLILGQNLARLTPMAEGDDVVPDPDNDMESDLPPPPKFLLVEYQQQQQQQQQHENEDEVGQIHNLQPSPSTPIHPLPPPPPPLPPASPDTIIDVNNNENNDNDQDEQIRKSSPDKHDYQEILTAITELDEILTLAATAGLDNKNCTEITLQYSTTIADEIIDYLSPRLAKELNISFGSTTDEETNYSFISSTHGDGSSACHSFLYDKMLF